MNNYVNKTKKQSIDISIKNAIRSQAEYKTKIRLWKPGRSKNDRGFTINNRSLYSWSNGNSSII